MSSSTSSGPGPGAGAYNTTTTSSSSSQESRWARWGKLGFDKSIQVSDWAAGYANAAGAKVGAQRFWPKSGDFPEEVEKCERILRAFTVEGVPAKEEKVEEVTDGKGNRIKKHRRLLKKIPPAAIKRAKGIAIYSSMRTGIAPFGGAGGTGLVMSRLPDGSWSAPSSMSPNNLSAGLLLGVEFFDVILLINSSKALESFKTHKFTLGAETVIAAGPLGVGGAVDVGVERAPVYSYFRTSAGLYGGLELIGQVFAERFDENERVYHWPGIKGRDILEGRVTIPPIVAPLHRALKDAELGMAQGGKLESTVYDIVKVPEGEHFKMLGPNAQLGGGKKSVANGRRNPPPAFPGGSKEVGSGGGGGATRAGAKVSSDTMTSITTTGTSSAASSMPSTPAAGASFHHDKVNGGVEDSTLSRSSNGKDGEGEGSILNLVHTDSLQTNDGIGSSVPSQAAVEGAEGEYQDKEGGGEGEGEEEEEELVHEGERLRLPPTPAELEAMEAAGIPDDEDLRMEKLEREVVYGLPPPPVHPNVAQYWRIRPTLGSKRPTRQLKLLNSVEEREFRRAQYTRLPPSPVEKDFGSKGADAGVRGGEGGRYDQGEMKPVGERMTMAEAEAEGKAEAEGRQMSVVGRGLDEKEAERIMDLEREGGEIEHQGADDMTREVQDGAQSRKMTPASLEEEMRDAGAQEVVEGGAGAIGGREKGIKMGLEDRIVSSNAKEAEERGNTSLANVDADAKAKDNVNASANTNANTNANINDIVPSSSQSSNADGKQEQEEAHPQHDMEAKAESQISPSPASDGFAELRTAPPSPVLSSLAHLDVGGGEEGEESGLGSEGKGEGDGIVERVSTLVEPGADADADGMKEGNEDKEEGAEGDYDDEEGSKTPVAEKASNSHSLGLGKEGEGGDPNVGSEDADTDKDKDVDADDAKAEAKGKENNAPTPNRPPRSRARGNKRGGKA